MPLVGWWSQPDQLHRTVEGHAAGMVADHAQDPEVWLRRPLEAALPGPSREGAVPGDWETRFPFLFM